MKINNIILQVAMSLALPSVALCAQWSSVTPQLGTAGVQDYIRAYDQSLVDGGSDGQTRINFSGISTECLSGVAEWTEVNIPEGVDVRSTGETGGIKFLREDGDGTSSWQMVVGAGELTPDELAAINGAAFPSASNVIATMADVSTGNVVNVLEYGAKLDGSDDTAALQAAALAVEDGGTYYVPKGTGPSFITGAIDLTLRSGIKVIIDNDIYQQSTSPVTTIKLGGISGSYENDITIFGSGSVDGNGSNVIGYTYTLSTDNHYATMSVGYTRGIKVTGNIKFNNGLVSTINFYKSSNILVDGISIDGSVHDNGIAITRDPESYVAGDANTYANAVVKNCTITNAHDFGLTSYDASGSIFYNNTVSNCGNSNADGWGSGGGISFEYESTTPNKKYDGVAYGNKVFDVTGKAFFVTGDYVTIRDNTVDLVAVSPGDTASFSGLGVYGVNTIGIIVSGNTVRNTERSPLYLICSDSTKFITGTIAYNTFSADNFGAVLIGISNVKILSNEISQGGATQPISILNNAAQYNQGGGSLNVFHNDVFGTALYYGIQSNGVANVTVASNNVRTANGIKLMDASSVEVVGNTTEGTGTGLKIEATVLAAYLANNNLQNTIEIANSAVDSEVDVAKALTADTASNAVITLGDNAGATHISIVDSDGVEVATIDSDGVISGKSFASLASDGDHYTMYANTSACPTLTASEEGAKCHRNDIGLDYVWSGSAWSVTSDDVETFTNKTMAASSNTFTGVPYDFCVAISDNTSDMSVGVSPRSFRVPRAVTVTGVRAQVSTAPVGSSIAIDVLEDGASILSTPINIDDGEKTSTTAAVPPVVSDNSIADDAEMTYSITQVGSTTAGIGGIVCVNGTISY